MLKANELRIGNYIHLDSLTDGTSIDLECKLFHLEEINRSIKYRYTPIEITEDWLIKFGFKKQLDSSYAKNDVSIFLDKRFKTNLYLQTNDSYRKFEWFGYECKIVYVHQLQNLYFALTGDELQVNVA